MGRVYKSISGQTTALLEGRYTFVPKPGYKRGYERGIHEIHPVRGPALKIVLIRLASRLVTPSQALVELNNSEFMNGHSHYKMDKFRKIVTDPYYAGIVEINKQVKVRNENGLHEPLISKEQHLELLKIMNGKSKNQSGPRKGGNPKYPLNNILSCDLCMDKDNNRYVGFDHSNGKNPNLRYEKYRCRACGQYSTREEVRQQVIQCFKRQRINNEAWKHIAKALDTVWKQEEGQIEQTRTRIQHKIKSLEESVTAQVEAATDPANALIRDDILKSIAKKKDGIKAYEDELEGLAVQDNQDKGEFLRFAFDFANTMGEHFLTIPAENKLRCKQIIFPAGFRMNANGKVYTPEISPLITLAPNKKDLSKLEKSSMVRVQGL